MTVSDILKIIHSLPQEEQNMLKALITNTPASAFKIEHLIAEERHTHGIVCPCCGAVGNVSRNGHRKDGKQRYLCKDCGKSSVANTNSITAGTRKNLDTWKRYIRCMVNGLSIRKSAELCDIHRNTSFIWRHKILDALQKAWEPIVLEGIVEADETFFAVSYKGNHKKSAFVMPRKPHKRGKSIKVRGLSAEQVCVPCAIDRSGQAISRIANLGRVNTKNLHSIFDNKIEDDATLCTDKMNAYVRFANKNSLNLIQLKSGKAMKGIYNIQRINSYHSKLKLFLRPFKGVSTKYLNNYLMWHNFVNLRGSTLFDKANTMLRTSIASKISVKAATLSRRPSIPIPVA